MYTEKGSMMTTYLEGLKPELQKSENSNITPDILLSDSIDALTKISNAIQLIDALLLNTKGKAKIHYEQLRDIIANERVEMEETIELLREQVESLKEELHEKDLMLQELNQELHYTNQELSAVLNSVSITIDEAKELKNKKKKIWADENPPRVDIPEVIGLSDSSIGKINAEVEQIDQCPYLTPMPCERHERFILKSKELKAHCEVLREETAEIRACSQIRRNKSDEVKARARKLREQQSKDKRYKSSC